MVCEEIGDATADQSGVLAQAWALPAGSRPEGRVSIRSSIGGDGIMMFDPIAGGVVVGWGLGYSRREGLDDDHAATAAATWTRQHAGFVDAASDVSGF